MPDFDSKDPSHNSSPDPDRSSLNPLSQARVADLASHLRFSNVIEGAVTAVFYDTLGLCDPDIVDYVSQIYVDAQQMKGLMPIDPRNHRPLDSINEALYLAAERESFHDGYEFVDFKDSIGRVILFTTSYAGSGGTLLSSPLDAAFSTEQLILLGKKTYLETALEAFDLRDPRTALWQVLSEDFDKLRYAMGEVNALFLR